MLIYLAMLERSEDEAAFIDMYNNYLSTLTRVGMSFCGNQSIVEDALQTTWMEVARNFVKISAIPCHKTASYLAIVMKNNCIDILRKEKKYTNLPEDKDFEGDDMAVEVQNRDEYQHLVKLIRGLPDIYREILERRLVLDERNRDIAKKLGLSEALVAKRFERGREMLIDILRKEEEQHV